MKVTVVSRSGREVIKGGLDLPDSVCVVTSLCYVVVDLFYFKVPIFAFECLKI